MAVCSSLYFQTNFNEPHLSLHLTPKLYSHSWPEAVGQLLRKTVTIRYYTGPVIYQAFNVLDPPSSTAPVETRVPTPSKLDARIRSAIQLFRENESGGWQHQNSCRDTFGEFLLSATAQLLEAVFSLPSSCTPKSMKLIPEAALSTFAKFFQNDPWRHTHLSHLFNFKTFLSVDCQNSKTVVSKNLGDSQDCYVPEFWRGL